MNPVFPSTCFCITTGKGAQILITCVVVGLKEWVAKHFLPVDLLQVSVSTAGPLRRRKYLVELEKTQVTRRKDMELLHKFAQPYISHFLFLSCLLDPPKTCNFVKLIKPCYFLTGLFWDAVDSHGFAGLFDGVYYIFTGESTCKADKLTIFARCLEIRIKRPVTVLEQTPRKKGCKFGGGLEDEPHPMSPAHKGQQTPDLRCATTRRLHIELCLW